MSEYFNGHYPALLEAIEQHFERARSVFEKESAGHIHALILGGGYGRGEGGVCERDGVQALYNDLDYFLFCDQPEDTELLNTVREFEAIESRTLGIDVEITCLRPDTLKDVTESMMFYDLICGHHVVVGQSDFLAKYRDGLDAAKIKPLEATRLLWNRGSGLFFARCRLEDEEAAGFIHRQHQKLALALGDAILCINGLHHALCRVRGERLQALEDPLLTDELRALHAEGVAFKERPLPPPRNSDELTTRNGRLRALWQEVYLALEARRLGRGFPDAISYARYPGRLFPDEPCWRCLLLAVRDRLRRGGALRPVTDYPRGALMRALVILNGETPDLNRVRRYLPLKEISLNVTHRVYETWWGYYS